VDCVLIGWDLHPHRLGQDFLVRDWLRTNKETWRTFVCSELKCTFIRFDLVRTWCRLYIVAVRSREVDRSVKHDKRRRVGITVGNWHEEAKQENRDGNVPNHERLRSRLVNAN
jgi:hypothetical protein